MPDWTTRPRRRFAPGRWGTLICRAAWDEAPGVRSFLLVPEDGSRVEHDPGQFMTFRIETATGTIERCYTIASSAARDGGIEITVKRQPGDGSGVLHDTLTPGATIEAFGPSGRFGPASWPDDRYALIAAGSGVTPMLSILRTAADRGLNPDVVLVQVAPTPDDLIAADDIARLTRILPGLSHLRLTTRQAGGARPTGDTIARIVPDMASRTVLCCGPQPFMEMVRETARVAGVPPERYGEESFDFTSPEIVVSSGAEATLRQITFSRSGKTFQCAETTPILTAARAAGLPMPSSCTRGLCGTCKTFKHSGEVVMAHDGGIRQREIDRGFILPCVSRPLTDIVLDC
ncbi:oxidoreductase FAD-binding domain-containing protein [Oceaniovalibus guishaninsula JLT2003]|uniref:Oxidoreductase FAD-binding domain-containing protein n=1 Tax=Oceaniovalibus guishaninsula JLT2003 TaxID=1231392 RepID=K2GRN5_9RHOB|nr:2Fe-2S iron-sulfur cluster-binding protein [Oceaniovalibus guishaninsula]EKE45276.1 oxidoreductase FAD-binding domain-containing protein [Oceaniovalibus guishaninsula JLT2003]